MKTNFKLQIDEVTGAWLLTIDRFKVPLSFPTTTEGDKRLIEAILKQLCIHRKFRVEES